MVCELRKYLSSNNIVSGYPNNEFRPYNAVTRAEFATMIAKSQGLSVGAASSTKFRDVPASHWASAAVNAVSSRGWISGYPNGTFGPNQPITMAEMYTIVSKVAPAGGGNPAEILDQFSDANSIPSWAQAPVASAVNLGIYVSEVTPKQLDPFVRASRADVSTTLAKLMNASFRTPLVATEPAPQPEPEHRLVSSGVLFHEGEDWGIRTDSGVYYIDNDFNTAHFDVGDYVNFVAFPVPGTRRNVIRLVQIIPTTGNPPGPPPRPSPRIITVEGVLKNAVEGGGWILDERGGRRNYRLESIGNYRNRPWFKEGARVRVEGRVIADRPNTRMQGIPLRVNRMQLLDKQPAPDPTPQRITIQGRLERTVEAGGWVVTDRGNGKKYLLLGIDQYTSQPWFTERTRLEVRGTPDPDAVTSQMEGIPFRVDQLRRAGR
jgi:hypothetical protein